MRNAIVVLGLFVWRKNLAYVQQVLAIVAAAGLGLGSRRRPKI